MFILGVIPSWSAFQCHQIEPILVITDLQIEEAARLRIINFLYDP